MIKLSRMVFLLFGLILLAAADSAAAAQEAKQESKPARPAQTRPAQKSADENADKADAPMVEESPDVALRRTLSNLSDQINTLTAELKRLRQENEHTTIVMELLLHEERLARIEEKLDQALEAKNQLDLREQEIQRRLRNIQQEVTLRGGAALRRDEAEIALRAEFNRALEDTRAQQSQHQERIGELQSQASQIRERVQVLRKRLERYEVKSEAEQKEP